MSDFLYPVALNVRDRLCVVVGGGAVGARKARVLCDAGAYVRIVSPTLHSAAENLVRTGDVEHVAAPFVPAHLDEAFMAIAATDHPQVNTRIAEAARERNILLNMAAEDESGEAGDFAAMARVHRGQLIIGVTTGGAGPALSARLRDELNEHFGVEWTAYTNLLGEMRVLAKEFFLDDEERTLRLRRLVQNEAVYGTIWAGDLNAAREEAKKCLFG